MRSASLILLTLLVALSGYNVVEARTKFLDAEFYTSLAHRLLSQLETAYGLAPEQAEVVQAIYGADAPTTEAEISVSRLVSRPGLDMLWVLLLRQCQASAVHPVIQPCSTPTCSKTAVLASFLQLERDPSTFWMPYLLGKLQRALLQQWRTSLVSGYVSVVNSRAISGVSSFDTTIMFSQR